MFIVIIVIINSCFVSGSPPTPLCILPDTALTLPYHVLAEG